MLSENQIPRSTNRVSWICDTLIIFIVVALRSWVPGESWGSKQAYRVTLARVRGLAVFAECLAGGWLAEISADLREAVAH